MTMRYAQNWHIYGSNCVMVHIIWILVYFGFFGQSLERNDRYPYSRNLSSKATMMTFADSLLSSSNRSQRSLFRLLEGETLGGLRGCESFEFGDEKKMEFYSPDYPNNYPDNITCIRVIKAESKTHQVVLDFRDEFHMEPSENCRFDYLEIRDGMFGYSPMLGKYCGHDYPPLITSTGSYLWLRFRSDENIEYTGFRAVYSYKLRKDSPLALYNDDPCFINVTGVETDLISQENIPDDVRGNAFQAGIDCMYLITVGEQKVVSLQWDLFALQYPNDCEQNYVEIFGRNTDTRLGNFCGAAAEPVLTNHNIMQVHYVVKKMAVNSTFRARFTAFSKAENCTEEEFNCQDGTCIVDSLHCDGITNCRTGSDEDVEECKKLNEPPLWKHMTQGDILIILIVFFLIIFGMCSTLIFNIGRKLIHDFSIIREHVNKSRESNLDDLGVRTPSATLLTPMVTIVPNISDHMGNMEISMRRHSVPSNNGEDHEDFCDIVIRCENHHTYPHTHRLETLEEDKGLEDVPEMRDGECQTRESLFRREIPSPPPPPLSRIPLQDRQHVALVNQLPVGFTTFGYKNKEREIPEKKFRAEAVIEMEKCGSKSPNPEREERRPFSMQSTKSAPDIIVTH